MQNPCFFIENKSGSNNKGVRLIITDSGAQKISAWQNETAVWADCSSFNATNNAIVSALNARYSLPNDGIFEISNPEASGIPVAPQHVIE